MNNYVKFGLLILAILGVLGWLAVGGISETKTYYKTVAEITQLGDQAQAKRFEWVATSRRIPSCAMVRMYRSRWRKTPSV